MKNFDDSPTRRTLVNVGGQIDFKIIMFWRMPATFSIGYGAAFEKDRKFSDEFMISLKIL
jgi:hypothetical protein